MRPLVCCLSKARAVLRRAASGILVLVLPGIPRAEARLAAAQEAGLLTLRVMAARTTLLTGESV